jgi:hypothetical protein
MRFSTAYKLGGTKTFRRASTQILPKKQVINGKTVSKGWGGNSQNWEKNVKKMFLSDGWNPALEERLLFWLETGDISVFTEQELESIRVFIQRDQAGAEALIVAYECEPRDYRQLFLNNVKPHIYIGLKLFPDVWKKKISPSLIEQGCSIDELYETPIQQLKNNPFWKEVKDLIASSDNWPTSERYYYFAKQTCHSANYDIHANTFRMNVLDKSGGKVVLTNEQAKYFLETYRSLFPEIPERNSRIAFQARENKILYNLFGHPYHISDYRIEDKLKEYYAWSSQSTVGEITRIATTQLYNWIQENDKRTVDILADTHDSFLLQCRLTEVQEIVEISKQFMNIEFTSPVDGIKFNMRSEFNVGFNWGPKKDSNKLGLQEVKWLKN